MTKPPMKSKRFLSTVFSVLWAGIIFSQTLNQTIAIADSMMQRGQYASAGKYYLRAYFFSDNRNFPVLSGKLGDAYFMSGKYTGAYDFYSQARKFEKNDSLKAGWFLKELSSLMMQKRFRLVLLEAANFTGKLTPSQQKELAFLKGTAYFGLQKYKPAEKAFTAALASGDSVSAAQIKKLLRSKRLHRPNPNTAYWLSIFVPGAGQIYAGDWKNGINSFVLNMTLAYFTVKVAYEYSLIDAFASVAPWLQRYYMGGYQRARRIARVKRDKNRNAIYREIYRQIYLQNNRPCGEN